MTAINAIPALPSTPIQTTPLVPAGGSASSGATFGDMLDAINPLQHIPIISSIYRASTGTSISSVSQIAGDTLYGGLVGGALTSFASSVADVAVKTVTGKSIADHVLATAEDAVSSTPTNAPAATPLVAGTPAATATAQASNTATNSALKAKVDEAVRTIYREQAHPERVAAQYQRVQTLDVGNKLLVKVL